MNTLVEKNFYLVSYLPDGINSEVKRLARKVSEQFHTTTFVNSWDPHLTVGTGLFVPLDCIEEVEQDLQEIAHEIQKIEVVAEGIGYIDNLNPRIAKNPYVVFIDIILDTALQSVFDRLEQYKKFRKDGYAITKYSPHVTLAYDDLTKENFEGTMEFLKNENPSFQFTLDNFSMVLFDEDLKRWVEYRRFQFGKKEE